MKNKIIMGTILTTALLVTTSVDAMGTAKVEFANNDNIKVGDTFTIRMNVTDIKNTYDGVVSMGGNLVFDSSMIEYISSKGTDTPYLFQINENYNYRIAGLDFTLDNGISETLTVYEFVFKALQEGNTTITFENAKLTDSQSYIDTTVLEKTITIADEKENIIHETTIVYNKFEDNNKINSTVETKVETNGKQIKISQQYNEEIENNEYIKRENKNVEQKIGKVEHKENIMYKIQKVFSNLFNELVKLFK